MEPKHPRKCPCDECKAKRAAYMRKSRAKKMGLQVIASDPTAPSQPDLAEPLNVEREVQKEIDMLTSGPDLPGVVASALAMARVLDNPLLVTIAPSAHRQLMLDLDQLHKASSPKKGTLTVVANAAQRPKK